MGVTELSRMLGTNPNLALSVLEVSGRWEAGRSAGGMAPKRKGWGRLQDRGGVTAVAAAAAAARAAGRRHRPRHFESSDEEAPPPKGSKGKPKPKAKPQAKGKGKPPPPNPRPPLCKKGAGTPMGMCRVWGTPGMSLGRRGAMGGPSAK